MKRAISLLAGVILCAGMLQGADPIAEGFQNPPKSARPRAWWIWFENAVDKNELLRELAVLDDAGFGGVNIEMNGARDWWNGYGPDVKTWLSPEWFECMKAVTDDAARRGMTVDTLANTGWSLGGSAWSPDGEIDLVPPEDRNGKMHLIRVPVAGGSEIKMALDDIIRQTPRSSRGSRIVFLRLIREDLPAFSPGKDLMDQVKDGELRSDIPEGTWALYAGVHVKPWVKVHASCGKEGWTVDPYDREAVRRYLDSVTPYFRKVYGENWLDAFRAFEIESVEFEGGNWTDSMEAEFEKDHGYALAHYLPMVCAQDFKKENFPAFFMQDNDTGGVFRRVRYDYHKTLTRLMYEAYYGEFKKWCHENGIQARIQTSGSPWVYDKLKMGAFADIPEPEMWLYKSAPHADDTYGITSDSSIMGSSGAHIAGNKIISCETFTCTDGVYRIHPWYIKQADDLNSIAGVNSTIVHTFPYSHPGASPYPAGFWYGDWSEDNPWWPYVKDWTAYNGRISYLMQEGQHRSQVLILDDAEEGWWHSPRANMDECPYKLPLWRAVAAQGYGLDFINEELLQQADFQDGRIVCQKAAWDVLLIPSRSTLEVKTAERIARLAEAGAKIRFIDTVPDKSPGLKDAQANDAAVRDLCNGALKQANVQKVPAPGDDLIKWTGKLLDETGIPQPCRIEPAAELLMQTQYSIGDRDFFFLCNVNPDTAREFRLRFARTDADVELWDPENGQRWRLPKNRDGSISFRLDPIQSVIMALVPGKSALPEYRADWPRETVMPIDSPWKAVMSPGEGDSWNRNFTKLADFSKTKDERLLNFSGSVLYETRFDVEDPSAATLLSLGNVQYTSEVWLNDTPLGSRWWGNHVYQTGDALKKGENVLRVKVTTPIWN